MEIKKIISHAKEYGFIFQIDVGLILQQNLPSHTAKSIPVVRFSPLPWNLTTALNNHPWSRNADRRKPPSMRLARRSDGALITEHDQSALNRHDLRRKKEGTTLSRKTRIGWGSNFHRGYDIAQNTIWHVGIGFDHESQLRARWNWSSDDSFFSDRNKHKQYPMEPPWTLPSSNLLLRPELNISGA